MWWAILPRFHVILKLWWAEYYITFHSKVVFCSYVDSKHAIYVMLCKRSIFLNEFIAFMLQGRQGHSLLLFFFSSMNVICSRLYFIYTGNNNNKQQFFMQQLYAIFTSLVFAICCVEYLQFSFVFIFLFFSLDVLLFVFLKDFPLYNSIYVRSAMTSFHS